jgi:hypothetical protein
MIYSGKGANAFGISYERYTKKGFHRIDAAMDEMGVKSTPAIQFSLFGENLQSQSSQVRQANINYGYVHQIKEKQRLNLYLGALLEAKFHRTDYNFGLQEETGYVLINSINPWLVGIFQLNPSSALKMEVHIPLLAWGIRPDYSIVDNEEIQQGDADFNFLYSKGSLNSLNKYQALNLSIGYRKQLTDRLFFDFAYRFDYLKYKDPVQINVLKNNFDVGLALFF